MPIEIASLLLLIGAVGGALIATLEAISLKPAPGSGVLYWILWIVMICICGFILAGIIVGIVRFLL